MNTTTNVALQTVATVLLTLGVVAIKTGFGWGAIVEILLGIIAYVVYELVPAKTA
jgi:uncharacterized membrane protein YqaE (UPF0057 family)